MLPRPNCNRDLCLEAPELFFKELGNLHDTRIDEIRWNILQHKITLVLSDLYANFLGLPEYPGRLPVQLILNGVCEIDLGMTHDEYQPRIMDFEVAEASVDQRIHVAMKCGRYGQMRIKCSSIAFDSVKE